MPLLPAASHNSLRHAGAVRQAVGAGWLTGLLARAAQAASDLPAQCAICHAWPSQMVCADCRSAYTRLRPRCPLCAIGLAAGAAGAGDASEAAATVCADCLRHALPHTAAMHAAVSYQWPWRGLIERFKFGQQPGLAQALAQLMAQQLGVVQALQQCGVLIPMPLHRLRLAERGYNQALLLARALRHAVAQKQGLDAQTALLLPQALVRTRHMPPQSTLPFAARQRNLRGVFAVPDRAAARLQQARVVLLDDVVTTGASVQAAAQALRRAGCADVTVVALARTEKAD